ncbi:MAG: hypothetical protein ACYDH4_12580, partial [Candidatus Cryosericum sp.]
ELVDEEEGTVAYQFALMQLRSKIEQVLQNIGRPATIKCEGSGLRVLTDAEAAVYNARQGDLARFKLFRAFRRNQAVDEAKLTDADRQNHCRTLEVQGKYVQALRKVVRQALRLAPVTRETPGLRVAAHSVFGSHTCTTFDEPTQCNS